MPTEVLATSTADEFIDFRARRPTARISEGVAELAVRVGVVAGSTEAPAGIQTALQEGFAAAGIPAIGIWASVVNRRGIRR